MRKVNWCYNTVMLWIAVLAIIGAVDQVTKLSAGWSAKRLATNALKDAVKSPSTLKIVEITYLGDSTSGFVKGEFDCQNSFGATIRSSFNCYVAAGKVSNLDLKQRQ
ncbi:MAG: hypothetical protein SFV81_27365 [Pirellulaceae bacterium]|nr:hypothetical protein [Pirellulaceae bacterium]